MKTCCEKCENYKNSGVIGDCLNPACPCHAKPEYTEREMTEGEKEIAKGLDKAFAPKFRPQKKKRKTKTGRRSLII